MFARNAFQLLCLAVLAVEGGFASGDVAVGGGILAQGAEAVLDGAQRIGGMRAGRRLQQGSSSCEASTLDGFSCMVTPPGLDSMTIHYLVGPVTGDDTRPTLGEDQIWFAVEAATPGWVGIGLAETAGLMAPADCVVGWMDGDEPVVMGYKVTARTISPADEDTSIEIGDVAGSEIDGITTISFTWTVSAGNIPVDLSSGAIALNAAFGGSDALVRHEFTDRIGFSVDFLSGSDGGESLPAADGDEPSSPADEDTTAGTGAGTGGNAQVDGDDDAMSAASSSCPSSELPGYSCVISVPGLDRMRLHYISGPTTGNDAIPTLTASEIRFAVEGATSGWVGIGFAEQSGAMAPSDCVVGWVEDGVPDVRPYRVMSRSISPGDEDTSIIITDVAASEVDGNTTIAFTWNVASGNVPVDPSSGIVLMNAALGGSDGLVQHGPGERSSFLLSGVGVNNDITRYYKAHGALMIIAWLLCIPAGILCAHHKWCLKGIGKKGLWFQIHRGLQVVGIMATIAAFGIAVNKFECCKTEDGDRHKPLGATVFAMSLMNVVLGLFRPGTEAPRRWMFNYAHYFFGYGSFVLAIPTVFLGIFAYDDLTTEGVSTWVVLAVVALAGLGGLYVCMEVVRWFMGGDDTRKPTPSTVQLTMPVTSNQPQPQEVNGDKWKGAV